MTTLQNADIIGYTLETIIRVIGRRSSENFALVTIDTVLKKLASKHEPVRYIEIKSALYSEGFDAVAIHEKINTVDTKNLIDAIAELLDFITDALGKGVGYFFIKEIRDDLEPEVLSIFKEYGVDLTVKHAEHLNVIKETELAKIQRMKNSERIGPLIKALVQLMNRHLPESEAVRKINTSIGELTHHYPFLSHVTIGNEPTDDGFYIIDIGSALDKVLPSKLGEAMHELVKKVGREIESKMQHSFVEDITVILGDENRLRVKELGVNFDRIEKALRQQNHDILLRKTLDGLLQIIGGKTSTSFAVASLEHLLEKLQEKHAALRTILIDKAKYGQGIDAVTISPEINTIESYELAKAIEAIIKGTQEHIEDKTLPFMEEFKQKLGKDTLVDLEKLGVNFHLLALRFK